MLPLVLLWCLGLWLPQPVSAAASGPAWQQAHPKPLTTLPMSQLDRTGSVAGRARPAGLNVSDLAGASPDTGQGPDVAAELSHDRAAFVAAADPTRIPGLGTPVLLTRPAFCGRVCDLRTAGRAPPLG